MDIRQITPELAVAPQIEPEDLALLKAQGFKSIIVNRPDHEVAPELSSAVMQDAAEAQGMQFQYLPYEPGNLTVELARNFSAATETLPTPILAYCRSGTRSSQLWALSQAKKRGIDEIIALASNSGYDLSAMRELIKYQADNS